MFNVMDYPVFVLVLSFAAMWVAGRLGWSLSRRKYGLTDETREDFGFILGASLTLLGLLIGFTFSMATNRYDQRKNYEEAEANAIGTEYVRADLLSPADADKVRALLRDYLDRRVQFYLIHDPQQLAQINAATAQLQNEMWSTVVAPAQSNPTPVVALAVSGMNDVLNSQGYTQAAVWNRIPTPAWVLMAAIAVGCNLLLGYGLRGAAGESRLLLILPLLVAIAFMLIADIDSPRRGIILVSPQNLSSLAESLRPH